MRIPTAAAITARTWFAVVLRKVGRLWFFWASFQLVTSIPEKIVNSPPCEISYSTPRQATSGGLVRIHPRPSPATILSGALDERAAAPRVMGSPNHPGTFALHCQPLLMAWPRVQRTGA